MTSLKHVLPALALAFAAGNAAAAYPEQPIRLVVGYAAGGTTDILARALGEQLATALNASVVIENKPGAAGSIGAAYVQNAKPDGYTVFIATVSSHGMNPALYSSLNYDPVKGFAPVSMLASIPLVLVADPKRDYKTVDGLVKAAADKPGTLNYSTSGNGSPVHIAAAMFSDAANLDVVHVPYRGRRHGQHRDHERRRPVHVCHTAGRPALVKAGKLDALAVTTKARSPQLPDIPTMAENSKFGNYEINTWNALLAPAGHPTKSSRR